MSMFSTNTLPSQTATPRLATMPALLKTAICSGYHFQITLPVVASSAYVFPSPVVTYIRSPITTGYDCWPSRAIGSTERKLSVKIRPI